jgi:protein-disulfide isomerase
MTAVALATGCKHAASSTQAAVEASPGTEVAAPSEPAPPPMAAAQAALPKNVDAKDLDTAERKVLLEVLTEQFDPCGKTRSFAQALDAGDCPLAGKLAAGLVGAIKDGQGKKQLVAHLLKDIERMNTVVQIPVEGSPRLGPADAKVVVVEFSDFECPHCRRASEPMLRLQKHYGFALYYKFFPLKQIHPNAEGAARAGWAANKQGKFWPLAEAMFDADALDWPAVQKLAQTVGLDMKAFLADFASDAAKAAVEADVKAGTDAGIEGTPSFFVSGHPAESLAQVQEMVRDLMQSAGGPLPTPLTKADLGEDEAASVRTAAHATPTDAPATPPAGGAPSAPAAVPAQ